MHNKTVGQRKHQALKTKKRRFTFIYLKDKVTQREKEIERDLPTVGSLPKWL